MRRTFLAATAAMILAAPACPALAMMAAPHLEGSGSAASLLRPTGFVCDWTCQRAWPPREYWQWGFGAPGPELQRHWDSPIGHFWGTPQPPLVPADVWAWKWHPPWVRPWRRHHRWRRHLH